MTRDRTWDAVVVGAGAAGLAAARALRAAGVRPIVLEARDRIGGRVLTRHHPELAAPIELGAEFVHGLGARTLALVDQEALPVVEIEGDHLVVGDAGAIGTRNDFFRVVTGVAARLRAGDERPVSRALAEIDLRDEERALVLEYVRGYHAADPERLSARAFADGERDAGPVRRQLRFVRGYHGVIQALARDLDPADVRLGARVRRIAWSRGDVRVELDGEALSARAAIVTVPAGVLLAAPGEPGAIEIAPRPAVLDEALGAIGVGAVCRVVLRLRRPLEDVLGRMRVSFVHLRDPDFPVWWTPYPLRAPMAVAWCGGPHTAEVSGDAIARATASLARWLGDRVAHDLVIEGFTHDWLRDPLTRGAYSYVRVGGLRAAGALADPIDATLWFAGEAWSEAGGGTVEGAITSGERAARSLVRQLHLPRAHRPRAQPPRTAP